MPSFLSLSGIGGQQVAFCAHEACLLPALMTPYLIPTERGVGCWWRNALPAHQFLVK